MVFTVGTDYRVCSAAVRIAWILASSIRESRGKPKLSQPAQGGARTQKREFHRIKLGRLQVACRMRIILVPSKRKLRAPSEPEERLSGSGREFSRVFQSRRDEPESNCALSPRVHDEHGEGNRGDNRIAIDSEDANTSRNRRGPENAQTWRW